MTDAVELEIQRIVIFQQKGQQALIVCKARVFPILPRILWRWNETAIGQTLTYLTLVDGSLSLSTISQASGDYVCFAETRQSAQSSKELSLLDQVIYSHKYLQFA